MPLVWYTVGNICAMINTHNLNNKIHAVIFTSKFFLEVNTYVDTYNSNTDYTVSDSSPYVERHIKRIFLYLIGQHFRECPKPRLMIRVKDLFSLC